MRDALLLVLALLAAGCASAPSGGLAVQGADGMTATDHRLPGLEASVEVAVTDGVARLEGTARNTGSRTYQVTAICTEPWNARVRDGSGNDVAWEEGRAHCEAFGLKPFKPGETLAFGASWDGQLRNDDGSTRPAPSGAYLFSGRFEVYTGSGIEESGERIVLEPMVTLTR